jgi:hypothetical protein
VEIYAGHLVQCTVPAQVDLRKSSFVGSCERGGGEQEIVLQYVLAQKIPGWPDVQQCCVQSLRVKKEPLYHAFKYLLPLPICCALYCLYYNGGAGGWCEEMEGDMAFCPILTPSEVAAKALVTVKPQYWARQKCQGGGSDHMSHTI